MQDILIITTVIGLLVGSFLNVVIYRLPIMDIRKKIAKEPLSLRTHFYENNKQHEYNPNIPFNLNLPRSACPNCEHEITAIENIPIISWLCLRGKCLSCGNPISARYPTIEALNAIIWFIVTYSSLNDDTFSYIIMALIALKCSICSIGLCIIAIWYDKKTIPRSLPIFLIILSVLACILLIIKYSFPVN